MTMPRCPVAHRGKIYPSITEAASALGVSISVVQRRLDKGSVNSIPTRSEEKALREKILAVIRNAPAVAGTLKDATGLSTSGIKFITARMVRDGVMNKRRRKKIVEYYTPEQTGGMIDKT